MSDARDAARYLRGEAARAARETRALGRGTVTGFQEGSGRPVVQLPTGAKILSVPPRFGRVSLNQAATLTRNGGGWEVLAPSPYGGGLGAPFSPPPEEEP